MAQNSITWPRSYCQTTDAVKLCCAPQPALIKCHTTKAHTTAAVPTHMTPHTPARPVSAVLPPILLIHHKVKALITNAVVVHPQHVDHSQPAVSPRMPMTLTCSCSQACTSLATPCCAVMLLPAPHAASSTGSTCCTTSLTPALTSSPALTLYCCRVGPRDSERYSPTARGSRSSCRPSSAAGLLVAWGSGRHHVLLEERVPSGDMLASAQHSTAISQHRLHDSSLLQYQYQYQYCRD